MEDPSAPCFAHLLVDGHPVDPQARRDVARFRWAQRKRLLAAREALTPGMREAAAARLCALLDEECGDLRGRTVAAYWPIRGEPDLRGWMTAVARRGARVALPVVVARNQPLAFHHWVPGDAMHPGVWGIPVPVLARPVQPDIVIVPLLGVDADCHRLGHGGGYYDRSLARCPEVHVTGVGLALSRLATIFPMPWDVPMHRVILDDGMIWSS